MPSGIESRFDQFQRHRAQLDKDGDAKGAMASIRRAAEYRTTPMWSKIVELVAHSNSVFAVGFQTMSYLASGLDRCVHVAAGCDQPQALRLLGHGSRMVRCHRAEPRVATGTALAGTETAPQPTC